MDPGTILTIVSASLIGSGIGLFTGLVPGIHSNTLASMLYIGYGTVAGALSGLIPDELVPLAVCCCIMSASVVHSFVDFVPSVFIGAPDAEDAVSVMPGHRLLLEGKGMEAVRSAAIGSLIGCSAAIVLAIPFQYVMLAGAEEYLNRLTKLVILIASSILIGLEWRKGNVLAAVVAFALSGILGILCTRLPIPCAGILGENTLMFPMLTGLFGLPILLESTKGAEIPRQFDPGIDTVGVNPGLKGVFMGCLAGWFPGITATVGASLSACVFPQKRPQEFIATVASVGTVTTVLSLVTLSVSGGGRSGTVIVIGKIIGESMTGFASESFLLLLLSCAIASLTGYWLTITSGRMMTGLVSKVDQRRLSLTVALFTVAMVLLMTGPWGMVVLAASVAIGYIPTYFGTNRTVLCGCLMVPVLLM